MKIKLLLLCMTLVLLTSQSMAQFAGGNGTKANPYQIATASQLNLVRGYLTNHFIQTADIDLAGYNWVPIGDGSNWFKGSYNGNGFSIHNLFIDTPGYSNHIGLFGYYRPTTAYDTIQNITLNNVNITAYSNIGGIVGFAYYPLNIVNCKVQGHLNGVAGVGGILGSAQYEVHVSNCFANVIIHCISPMLEVLLEVLKVQIQVSQIVLPQEVSTAIIMVVVAFPVF